MQKIKLGIVGCGYWGPNLVRNFVKIPSAEVVVACDINKKRLMRMKTLYPFLHTTNDYYELLNTPQLDAVVISTPLVKHFELTKAALKAGKHVLVEKPFVSSLTEAKELVELAQKRDLKLMVDHTFEYTAAVNKIKELVKSDELGDIYTVDMIRVNLGLFQQDHNVVWDLAYHDISILLYVISKLPVSVIAVGEDFIQKGVEDSAYVIFRYQGKTLASLHLSWLDPYKIRRVTIVGSKKMLVYDDNEPSEKIKILDKGVSVRSKKLPQMPYYETFAEFSYLYKHGDIYIPRLEQREPLQVMAEHFIEVLQKNKKPRSGGKQALEVVRVIEAAEKSLKNGGKEIKIGR